MTLIAVTLLVVAFNRAMFAALVRASLPMEHPAYLWGGTFASTRILARTLGLGLALLALAPVRAQAELPDAGMSDRVEGFGALAAAAAPASGADGGFSDFSQIGDALDIGAPGTRDAGAPPVRPPKRPVPNYDGRAPTSTTTEDILLAVPRAALYPVAFLNEQVVTRPVGALATTAEQNNWANAIQNFFTFGPNHEGGLFPTFLIDFGLRPSIGVHFYWNFLSVKNRISVDAAWGGPQWVTVAIADRQDFSPTESLVAQLRWDRRSDSLFYGIGPEVSDTFRSRVGNDVLQGSLTWARIFGPLSLRANGAIRRLDYANYTCCSDPTLQQRVEAGQLPPPPGYQQNYTAGTLDLSVILDTRKPDQPDRSGWRLAFGLAPTVDLQAGGRRSWLRYAAAVEGNWDVTGTGRVLSLGVTSAFIDPLGSEPVPFTELIALGGTEPFAGFLPGRLLDRSALVAELGWHWPVFAFLDGIVAASVGNVFGPHLEGFNVDLFRLSAEIGLRSRGAGLNGFQIVLGMGTDPFRNGFNVSSFRLVFGVSYGP